MWGILSKFFDAPDSPPTSQADQEAISRTQPEEIFRSALEACPSGMLLLAADGTIAFANSVLLEWFGYKREDLQGRHVDVLVPPCAQSARPSQHAISFATLALRSMGEARDLCGVAKDGAEIAVEITLGAASTPKGAMVLANVMNISRRKRMENALVAKSKEMEQLVYAVSHDLRSPLITIEGFTGMLDEHLKALDLERAADDLARVKRATRTMARLIRDVLKLSHIHREQMKLEVVDLRDVLDEAAESLEGPLHAAGAQLAIEGSVPAIYGDRGQLVQVFLNLIGNAVKFGCRQPGAIVTVRWSQLGDELACSVQDEGPGVDLTNRERIFQPFQRGDHDSEGSGLGLAIVRNVMELHQGRTWVDSAPGGGATFWVAFPAISAATVPAIRRPVRQLV